MQYHPILSGRDAHEVHKRVKKYRKVLVLKDEEGKSRSYNKNPFTPPKQGTPGDALKFQRTLFEVQNASNELQEELRKKIAAYDAMLKGDFTDADEEIVINFSIENETDINENAGFIADEIASIAEALLLDEMSPSQVASELYEIAEVVRKLSF